MQSTNKPSQKSREKVLEAYKISAKETIDDPDKFEKFLRDLENKLRMLPKVGSGLAYVPILASLIRSYYKKEYTEIPTGSIVAIVAALLYFVSPVDLIPDSVPVVGYVDDIGIIALCWKLVKTDVKEYETWRQENKLKNL